MRIAVFGAVTLASLLVVALASVLAPSPSFGQRMAPTPGAAGGGLITVTAQAAGDRCQQVTVISPETQTLAVYHIDLSNGAVTLKSVRNIHWDLQLNDFNATIPLPGEIRSSLEQRQ